MLNRVCILGIFCPKQGQGFKPSTAHLYPNIGRLPPPQTPHPAGLDLNRVELDIRTVYIRYTQSAVRGPQSTRYTSLLIDAPFSLQSQSSAGDKIQTAGDLLTASARG